MGESGVDLRLEAALQPGEELAPTAANFGLEVGDDDDFELQAFGFVDGHQLDATVAGGGGVGQRGELVEGGVERWAEQVLLAGGQTVQTAPHEVEVGAGGGIDAIGTAKTEPDLLEPGAGRGGRLSTPRKKTCPWGPRLFTPRTKTCPRGPRLAGAEGGRFSECGEDAGGGAASGLAEE